MLNKKGAMFGLDARIALAIFGALSVISGAALYSAIQEARSTAYYQNATEIGKAIEAYYLDAGKNLDFDNSTLGYIKAEDIINNTGENNWQGPYFSAEVKNSMTLNVNYGDKIIGTSIYVRTTADWPVGRSNAPTVCTLPDPECYNWIVLDAASVDEKQHLDKIFLILDEKYDNSDGDNKGIIRIKDFNTTTDDNRLFIQTMPYIQ